MTRYFYIGFFTLLLPPLVASSQMTKSSPSLSNGNFPSLLIFCHIVCLPTDPLFFYLLQGYNIRYKGTLVLTASQKRFKLK